MPYKHPMTGLDTNTIPEQIREFGGCGNIIKVVGGLLIAGMIIFALIMGVKNFSSAKDWCLGAFGLLIVIWLIDKVFRRR
jgi:hypothetical protein